MNCVSCGTTNLEGAVHCHNCGVKIAPTVQTQQGHANPANVAPVATEDKLKVVKEYFQYVWVILKKPHTEAFAKDKTHLLFGAINIIAFAILFGLSTWFLMNSLLNIFGESASFLSSFIVPVIGSAFFLAIGGCVAFGLTKLNKLTTNFVDVLSQWFAYMAIPAAIMPLIFLTALVGLSKLSIVLVAVAFISVFSSAASIVKNYKLGESNVIDPMYSTTIFFAVQGLVLYFVLNQFVVSFINAFAKGFGNMFDGW